MSADDQAELWIATKPRSTSISDLRLVTHIYTHTSYRNLFQNNSQIGDYVSLEGGKDYYVQGFHFDKGGESHFSVAVEVPEERPNQHNTLDEVQEFAIWSSSKGHTIELKIWGWSKGEWQIANTDQRGLNKKKSINEKIIYIFFI